MSKFTPLSDELHAYLVAHGARQDEVLRRVQEETAAMGGIARMQVAPDEGALLTLLCRMLGARQAIEVGTFTGYSAICIARGLETGGRLIACELDQGYAATAARNLELAGVADRVEIRVGPALETLRALPERAAFDFAFIDADKPGYAGYYEEILARLRPGGMVILDNVLTGGGVVDPQAAGAFAADSIAAMRDLNERIRDDARVEIAMLGVADGITLARKR